MKARIPRTRRILTPIGEWVIRQACCDAAAWPGPVCVALNVSPAQFKSEHLVETIVSVLAASGPPAGCVIVGLGHTLDMTTVAEGCTDVQGYLISRPVPVEQLLPLLSR